MKLFLIVLSFLNVALFSMDRQVSCVSIDSNRRSPFGDVESNESRQSSEEDELCEFAISRYLHHVSGVEKYIKPFLKNFLQETPTSPDLRHSASNAEILKMAKSSKRENDSNFTQRPEEDNNAVLSVADQRMYDMIVRAMHSVIEERERELQEKERLLVLKEARIKEKYSGKKTALIAGAVGTLSTIITTICATLVTFNSK